MKTRKLGSTLVLDWQRKIIAGLPYLGSLVLVGCLAGSGNHGKNGSFEEVRLITLDPGHFHAALLQKEMLPGVSWHAAIYAPLGPDLLAHLNRIAQFNARKDHPTHWELEIYTGPDFFQRMLEQRRGNVVVLSGRNRDKIAQIQACVEAGFHVLADKPWVIETIDLPKLEAVLTSAENHGTSAYDIMTERFDIAFVLLRELVNDAGAFGTIVAGTEQEPAVFMESLHYLMKNVAGAPLLRPAWFFDINQQGEGLSDIGTHLADLVQWSLFPEQAISYMQDIRLTNAKRWPTLLTRAEFQRVTGEADFPASLVSAVKKDHLEYYCNNLVSYTLRGIQIQLGVLWNYEAAPGVGDSYRSVFRGTRSRIELRQGAEQHYRSELYVVPNRVEQKAEVFSALGKKVTALRERFPGLAFEDHGGELMISIPEQFRVGHEAHFGQVVSQFLHYMKDPRSLPSWEKPNMLSKYYVTTKGVELARRHTAVQ